MEQRADGRRLAGGVLERQVRSRRRLAHQRADGVEALGPGHERVARLVAHDLGGQSGPFVLAHVRQVGEHQLVVPVRESRPHDHCKGQAQAGSAFARATSTAAAELSDALTIRSGRSWSSASATAPEPVPTSCTRAPSGSSSASSTSSSVSGTRDQHAHVHLELDVTEAPCARGCRPPARGPRGGVSARTGAATRREAIGSSGEDRIVARSTPSASATSSSASRRGVSQPAASSAGIAASSTSRAVIRFSRSRARRPPACGASRRPRALR